jgi:rod shape-determining protein MreC
MKATTPANLGRAPVRYDARLAMRRRRNLLHLAMFLAAAAMLGQLQSRQDAARAVVQEGAAALATPLIGALSAVGDGLRSGVAALPHARELEAENRRLRARVEDMQARQARLAEAALESKRLRALLGLRASAPGGGIAARVIGMRLSQWPEGVVIDKGRGEGVRPRQAVITPAGLVGRVYSVSAHAAVVVPLTDRNSSAAAMIQRSRDTGILMGTGDGCDLKYLHTDADVKPGDVVLTCGAGGIFPKGIVIGVVESVARDDTASMKCARVRHNVNLRRLEEVLVVGR